MCAVAADFVDNPGNVLNFSVHYILHILQIEEVKFLQTALKGVNMRTCVLQADRHAVHLHLHVLYNVIITVVPILVDSRAGIPSTLLCAVCRRVSAVHLQVEVYLLQAALQTGALQPVYCLLQALQLFHGLLQLSELFGKLDGQRWQCDLVRALFLIFTLPSWPQPHLGAAGTS